MRTTTCSTTQPTSKSQRRGPQAELEVLKERELVLLARALALLGDDQVRNAAHQRQVAGNGARL